MNNKTNLLRSSLLILSLFLVWSCSVRDITDMRINSMTLLAVDENNTPVAGAIVQTSDDQNVTTGKDGRVGLRFPAYGVFEVTVTAPDRAPARLTVTMPSDRSETVTAHLGKPGTGGDMSINLNLTGLTAGLSRMMAQMYPMIFQSMFSANGYSIDLADYKPGEWTEWRFSDNQAFSGTMRKSFLKQLDNGQQWWQVVYTPEDSADKITMEVLFAKDRTSIRRMRQQSGKEAAAEVPVSEGWYVAPMKLTQESLQGAVVKRGVSIKVPAGTYTADILQFGQQIAQGTLSIWRSTKVPGGVVKTEVNDADGSKVTSELKAQGTGAKTLLGSY